MRATVSDRCAQELASGDPPAAQDEALIRLMETHTAVLYDGAAVRG